MGPDPRIADFISANRARLTREAITQQLREAGYEQEAIDATWAVLDTPDADDEVGEGFWGRFWMYLIGLNVAAFLLVGLVTRMIPNSPVLAVVLGIALAIGVFITLGVVSLIRPTRLGRGAAMAIGATVPLVFTFLIAGACYALVGAIGPPPPPPSEGVMELQIDPPIDFAGSGAAYCQRNEGFPGFSIYPQQELGAIGGRPVHASVDSFPAEGPEGGPVPAPLPGGEVRPSLNIYVSLQPRSESDPPQEWFMGPGAEVEIDASSDGLSGTVTFEGLEPAQFEPGGTAGGESISGSISWECEGEGR